MMSYVICKRFFILLCFSFTAAASLIVYVYYYTQSSEKVKYFGENFFAQEIFLASINFCNLRTIVKITSLFYKMRHSRQESTVLSAVESSTMASGSARSFLLVPAKYRANT